MGHRQQVTLLEQLKEKASDHSRWHILNTCWQPRGPVSPKAGWVAYWSVFCFQAWSFQTAPSMLQWRMKSRIERLAEKIQNICVGSESLTRAQREEIHSNPRTTWFKNIGGGHYVEWIVWHFEDICAYHIDDRLEVILGILSANFEERLYFPQIILV